MKLYSAFDLHSNNSYLSIIDENGNGVFHRKVKDNPQLVVQILNPFKNDIEGIVVDSTFNGCPLGHWMVDLLSDGIINIQK